MMMINLAGDDVPNSYNQVMSQPDADSWLKACQDELLSLKETQTYSPVNTDDVRPVNIIGCHWVFRPQMVLWNNTRPESLQKDSIRPIKSIMTKHLHL